MSELTEWVKPNGTKIMLNNADATVQAAKNKGWKMAEVDMAETKEEEAPKRRGRPPKEA